MNSLFSQNCLICRQESINAICAYCQSDLDLFNCQQFEYNLMHCPNIQKGLKKVSFPHILALSDYQWPISKLLTGLKFSAKFPHAHALARLFVKNCLATGDDKPQFIVPIPLHKNRFLTRKFNQSIELAKHISQLSNIPMNTNLLNRVKSTRQQTDLTAVARKRNLRNAFCIPPTALEQLIEYQHIALFDDVVTTGTTINSAYNLLHKANPKLRIDVWSICITLQR
ncbi:ComF family protein [Paraglaciecola aquimarina]|uniref:ComF family protein n=1 Tax=Paraglaciecola algarum TaxID=3050085 RepID=A0ABS9DBI3_9ALTE|nr:ComF family protein [Paraglaciecola sp. G1-23]MCF2950294.1 ComF family protein [Paraglaciecola sp. G1-23]